MSDDLIKRLRDGAGLLNLMDENAKPRQSTAATQKKMLEAADEIELLRSVYQSAVKGRQEFRQSFREQKQRTEAAEAREAKLREALKMMVEEKCDYMAINNLGYPETQHTIKFARQALRETSND